MKPSESHRSNDGNPGDLADYIRSCEVKQRWWWTPLDAAFAALAMERKFPNERFDYYQCRWFDHWHIGHMRRWEREA